MLTGPALLAVMAERMEDEALRNPDRDEQGKTLAMARIFSVAGQNIRTGSADELELAVLALAKLGTRLIAEEY